MRKLRRLSLVLAAAALGCMAMATTPAIAAFGVDDFEVTFSAADGSTATQAGSHPFSFTTDLGFETIVDPDHGVVPDGATKDLRIDAAVGLIANPRATERCSNADFINVNQGTKLPNCPNAAAVGTTTVELENPGSFNSFPVYNLVPPPGSVAKLGFIALGVPVAINIGLNTAPPYNGVATLANIAQPLSVYGALTTLWGNPADPAHDPFRGNCVDAVNSNLMGTVNSKGKCPANTEEKPFFTLPRSCTGPLHTAFSITSWQGGFDQGIAATQGMSDCPKLGLKAEISARPTTESAESGSGLDFDLDIDDEGLSSPTGIAQSDISKTVVTLPEGVTANPSLAEGLDTCPKAGYEAETLSSTFGEGCPQASKIGTVAVQTPLLEGETLSGQVFIAQQDDPATPQPGAENPFDSLLALYIVIKDPNLGVLVKLAGKVEPDPRTGQLITTFDDLPQLPFSHFNFHFREGARSPLITPPACGDYTTKAQLTPSSGGPVVPVSSTFHIGSGVGGGPCPSGGVPPFNPGFMAGSINNNAGSYSPFYMRLLRGDGEQDMTKFSSVLPPGVLGSLKGVGKCPDAAIEAAKAKTGRQELASPSCPADSKIGRTLAGAGVGSALTYVPGAIYLAGPYKGDPLSVVSITPAVAGPFDAGTVAIRLALTLNPRTAEVEVDGAASDPIPHILKGIPLKVRDLRVYADRPNFTLNPTSCDPSSTKATLFGGFLDVFSSTDDVPVDLESRYQAANCLSLGFKPKLSLQLKGGGTKRGGHPALLATYRPRPGDANLEGLVVRLPRSAFLDQAHIRTICTRIQFAADACPKGAQYGFIKAWTPLLDEPLAGPVWLRSSSHKLPDLVFDLHGLVDVEVATRIDSQKGGIRASLESAPDAPITKVELRMQGGKKGLIINSRDLCAAKSKANVELSGQNGKRARSNPVMRASCGGKRAKQ
jgi:hypothetical protein